MTEEQMKLLAEAVCNVMTDADIDALTGLLSAGADGCDYAAEDYAERANFEDKHCRSDEAGDYRHAQDRHGDAAHALGHFIDAIKAQNDVVQGRTP